MPEIGDTARALKISREIAGLDQKELAALARINHTTISGYESGSTAHPQRETFVRVTAALGMTQAEREEIEGFVRQIRARLMPKQLGENDSIEDSPPAFGQGIWAWKKETAQVILEGSRFAGRLLHLVLGLLLSIAEAVLERRDSKPGTPS